MKEVLIQKIKLLIEYMGFKDNEVIYDEEHRKISLIINDDLIKNYIPEMLSAFDNIINLIARRSGYKSVVVDLNYYRKERERLIVELAKAAAKKALLTKEPVELPPMNSYERRLIHLEISHHPDLTTESYGEGKERRVVIKPLPKE